MFCGAHGSHPLSLKEEDVYNIVTRLLQRMRLLLGSSGCLIPIRRLRNNTGSSGCLIPIRKLRNNTGSSGWLIPIRKLRNKTGKKCPKTIVHNFNYEM